MTELSDRLTKVIDTASRTAKECTWLLRRLEEVPDSSSLRESLPPLIEKVLDVCGTSFSLRLVAESLGTCPYGDPARDKWSSNYGFLSLCATTLDEICEAAVASHSTSSSDYRGKDKGNGDASHVDSHGGSLAVITDDNHILTPARIFNFQITLGRVLKQLSDGRSRMDMYSLHRSVSTTQPVPEPPPNGILSARSLSPSSPDSLKGRLAQLSHPSQDRPLLSYYEEKRAVEARNNINAAYPLAATAWISPLVNTEWRSLRDSVLVLLDLGPKMHGRGNFIQCLAEYCRQTWPKRYVTGPHAGQALDALRDLESRSRPLSLSFAAAMGLSEVVREVITTRAEVDWAIPLYSALLGPSTLLPTSSRTAWERINEPPYSIAQAETLRAIMQTGYKFTRAWLWDDNFQPAPPDYLLFLVCLRLRDAELFIALYNLCGPISDQFKQLVRPGPFWEPATSAYEVCASLESREYLNDVLVRLMGYVYPLTESYPVFEGAFKLAQHLDLHCAKVDHEWREASIQDSEFLSKVHSHIRGGEAIAIRRLVQDPRWDANLPYDREQRSPEESDGGTILHMAVEAVNGDTRILETLLESGADISRNNNRGRTPLMLCKRAEPFRLLVQYGASTLHRDIDGRTCWHFAAAKGDFPVLMWLAREDPHMTENLRVVTEEGYTPLAEAVLSVTRLKNQEPAIYGLEALVFLCDLAGGDTECVKSPLPLLHSAVQWGDENLIHKLLSLGVDPNPIGISPLHYLTPSASVSFVRLLQKVCTNVLLFEPLSQPIIGSTPQATPAETLLGNLALTERADAQIRANHQSAMPHTFNFRVFLALLTPEVLESKDVHGMGLWERYCRRDLASLAKGTQSPNIIVSAAEHLVGAKALRRYEEETGSSGIALFYWCSTADPSPRVLEALIPIYSILLRETLHLAQFIKSPAALRLATLLVTLNSPKLLGELLRSGVSVHRPPQGRDRRTLLETACAPAGAPSIVSFLAGDRCTKETFEILLNYADKARLDDLDANSQGLVHMLINPSVMHRDEKLKMLLDKGASPNLMRWGTPALVSYILERQIDAALILLSNGGDPNLVTKDGMDASLAAASRGSIRMLDNLKAVVPEDFNWARTCRSHFTIVHPGGVQITTTASNCNALHLAAFNGYGLVIQFYLHNFGLDVNYPIQDDLRRPVHFAAISGSSSCIRVLHGHDADLDARTRDGSSALHTAVRGSQAQAVKTLLELGPANPIDNELMTPFMHALRIGFTEITRLFVDVERFRPAYYPSVLRARYVGQAIEAAIRASDVAQCRSLLSVTGLVDFETSPLKCGGCTPVFMAVREAQADVLAWLISIGATGFVGSCPLHSKEVGFNALNSLCWNPQLNGCLEAMLDAYLKEGIDWGCAAISPLHAAARENNHGAIMIIADHVTKKSDLYRQRFRFSDFEQRNKKSHVSRMEVNFAPQHKKKPPVARERGKISTPRPNKWDATPIRPNRRATFLYRELAYTSIPRYVLDQGIRLEGYARDAPTLGWTALHFAVSRGHEEATRALLSLGADPNAEDEEHNTPLYIAVRNGFDGGVEMLLAAGAHADRAHGQGFTPLMASIEAGNLDMGRMLVARGANIRAVDPDGMGLLNLAGERTTSPALVRYLQGLGLSPYRRDKAGYMPVDDMILNYDMLGYVLNGDFDLTRVQELNKGFFSLVIELNRNNAVVILKRLLRRLPAKTTRDLVNNAPPRFISALCSAVHRDCLGAIDVLVRYGADVNIQGCAEGTPLMAACARGRLDSVRLLVERGAWLAYWAATTTGEPGEERVVVRNALDFAAKFPEIQRWLLVERCTETKALLSAEQGTDTREPEETKPWSGPWTVCYKLQGSAGEHFREPRESRLDFLERMADVRSGLAGRVLGSVELVRASGAAAVDVPDVSVWDLERETWSAMAMWQMARPGWFRDKDNSGPARAIYSG